MSREYQKPYGCAVEASLAVLGGRWKAVIVYHLMQNEVMRFGELGRSIPDVSQRMLTNQLRELEEDGIVARKVYAQVPPRVEYSVTPYGHTLKPVLLALCEWGAKHLER